MKFRGDQGALFQLARRAGLSQQDVATHLGMKRQHYHRYTSGDRELPEHRFKEVYAFLQSHLFQQAKDAKISQQDISDVVGIPRTLFSKYCTGKEQLPYYLFADIQNYIFETTGEDFEDKKIV